MTLTAFSWVSSLSRLFNRYSFACSTEKEAVSYTHLRLTAVYQGDLHIGMDLGSQDALCLLRLFVGDAFAVDQGDKGGVFLSLIHI